MEHEKLQKLLSDHPNRIPVILWQTPNFKSNFKLIKHKYLVNSETTVGNLLFHIKHINNLKSDKAIYLFINEILLCSSDTFGFLRTKHNDSVLNITIDCQNVFGQK